MQRIGGTIDKEYPQKVQAYAFEFGLQGAMGRILNQIAPKSSKISTESPFLKDSQEVR